MFYRVQQFLWAFTSKLERGDIEFLNKHLNDDELRLFYMLPRNEQVHSVKVAIAVETESKSLELYDRYLIKAALLHDIGKVNSGLNPINKSIMVILHRISPKFLRKFIHLKIVNAYYNHPEIALSLLERENEQIKYLIKNHHNYSLSNNDEKLKLLQRADSNN